MALVVLAVILTLSSCRPQGLSKQELISQGDQVCKATSEELNPLFAKLFPTGNETPAASDAAPTMKKAAELVRKEAESIKSLGPSEGSETEFAAIVRALERSARLTEESAQIASQGDTDGYLEKLQEANIADQDARDLMVEFGFEDCAGATL